VIEGFFRATRGEVLNLRFFHKIDQNINGELAPGFIRGGKPLANLFAVKFLFGFEYTF
jgi:hypothetical protein